MKVLRIIPSLDAADGGPSTAAIGMAVALARAGATVTQVATVAPHESEGGDGEAVVKQGVEYRLFHRSLPGSFKHSFSLGRWVRRHAPDYDVIHVEALFSYATIPGCRGAIAAGIPYVLAPLGSLNDWSRHHRAWKKRPYLALVERRHLDAAAALHANSDSEGAALAKAGYGEKTHIIPLGVDIPPLAAPRPSTGGLHVLYLSRLHPIKGLPLLLEAVAGAKAAGIAIRLTVAGTGEASYRRKLGEQAVALGIGEDVAFVGHLAGAAKEALFRSADLFALTSYQESFGLAILEAMAHGVPVLVTDRGGVVDDVRRAGAGDVVGTDAGAIRTALIALAGDPNRRRALGLAARALAVSRFSWDRTASGLLALYDAITRATTSESRAHRPALAR